MWTFAGTMSCMSEGSPHPGEDTTPAPRATHGGASGAVYFYAVAGAFFTLLALWSAAPSVLAGDVLPNALAPVIVYAFSQVFVRMQLRKEGATSRRSLLWFVP